MGLLTRRAIALVPVGADLLVAEAVLRGHGASWRSQTVAGFFDAESSAALPDWARAGKPAASVLLWPTDAVLRREIDIAGQSIDQFRAAVGDNLGSFFPAANAEDAFWDVAPITGAAGSAGAWIAALPRDRVQPALDRLAAAGLKPTRLAPSAFALPIVLRSIDADQRPSAVLEVTPTGWALHAIDGLRWNGCRAGAGPPSEAVLAEAARRGALICRWQDESPAGDHALDRDMLALGGAMLGVWPRLSDERGRAPSFNFIRRRERANLLESPALRWTAAAAAVVVSTMILADATVSRARAERSAVLVRAQSVGPAAEQVEAIRTANEGLIASHTRLWRLEDNYRPRWRILADLSLALPAPAWVERLEIGDEVILADILAPGAAEVLEALEASPAFTQVKQLGPATTLESGESRLRVEARLVGPTSDAAPEAEAAP